jgi:hypothetical protein
MPGSGNGRHGGPGCNPQNSVDPAERQGGISPEMALHLQQQHDLWKAGQSVDLSELKRIPAA